MVIIDINHHLKRDTNMKKLIVFIIVISTAVFFTGCTRDDIDGIGQIITEERNHRNFDGVEVAGSIEVHLVHSNTYGVRVETYENLMPYVETFITNDVLVVRMAQGYSGGGNETQVWIYAPNVYEIKLAGSGLIVTDNYYPFGDYLEVGLTGSGRIDVRGSARTADVTLSGSGDIFLDGSGNRLSVYTDGSGDVRAFNYTVDEADVRLFGSGSVQVDAWLYLDAQISGSGDIIFEGNPRIQSSVTGSGLVRRRY